MYCQGFWIWRRDSGVIRVIMASRVMSRLRKKKDFFQDQKIFCDQEPKLIFAAKGGKNA